MKLKKVLYFIFGIFLLVCGVVGYVLLSQKEDYSKDLVIVLNGNKEINIKYGEEYTDLGATAKYKDIDLTNDIKIDNNLDNNHVGKYEYKYKIKYNDAEKEIIRTINVIDDEVPTMKLNGRKELSIVIGGTYEEKGATASDLYDGDITKNIKIDSSNLDTNKIGKYKIIYSISDSSGNETKQERVVKVVEKPKDNQKIAVLNYHFFYKDETDICHESICLQIDKFREQLDYLKNNGFYTLTMDEFVKWMYKEIELPEKSVLITVDDGAFGTSKERGNYLIPILEEYNMYGTLFLITGWWPIENYQSDHLDVRSHTNDLHYEYRKYCEHRSKVNCVSYDELIKDLKASIDVVKNTDSFCYPFYEYTDQSIKAVKEVGFKVAFVGGSRKASRNDDKYKIPRYVIYDSTPLSKFISYVS